MCTHIIVLTVLVGIGSTNNWRRRSSGYDHRKWISIASTFSTCFNSSSILKPINGFGYSGSGSGRISNLEGSEIQSHLANIFVATANFSVASTTGSIITLKISAIFRYRISAADGEYAANSISISARPTGLASFVLTFVLGVACSVLVISSVASIIGEFDNVEDADGWK